MIYQERKRFSFVSKGLPEDTFTVVRFTGADAISRPYEYDIMLASEDPDIDLKAVLQNPATLTILRGDDEFPIHGLPARFEQLHELEHRVFYRACLVPRLWLAGLYRENQIFLDKTVPQVIEEILKQAGLQSQDYEFKLTRSYPAWEYICQYQETDLDFISRWMEREGIYYFFEQNDQGEKLIITDSLTAHQDIQGEKTLYYSPPSGLVPAEAEVIKSFVCRQRVLPKKVILKDYNYRKPSLEVKAESEVDPKGRGETYIYGEHFKNPGQGKDLAKIRAEELLCRETEFHGEATAPTLAPGFIFELADHFRNSHNRKYLVIEVEHQGTQTGLQLAGLEAKQTEGEKEPGYSNRFTCIPSDVQFRPERSTPRPRINGTMTAFVDAAGDGHFAELDDQGRYKVILPFDLSGKSGGKASRYIRMAQPYSGPEYGMHFPLHKGAEVLLSFVDGDPDRPVISSTVPNPEKKSPVTANNQARSIVRDNAGNEIIFDTQTGKEHIWLYSPNHNSSVSIGKSINFFTDSNLDSVAGGAANEWILGVKTGTVLGSKSELLAGWATDVKASTNFETCLGWTTSVNLNRKVEYNRCDEVSINRDDYYKEIGDCGLMDSINRMQLQAGSEKEINSRFKMDNASIAIEKLYGETRSHSTSKWAIFWLWVLAATAIVTNGAQAAMVPIFAKKDEDQSNEGKPRNTASPADDNGPILKPTHDRKKPSHGSPEARDDTKTFETGTWLNTFIIGGAHLLLHIAAVATNIKLKRTDVDKLAKETDNKTCKARIELNNKGDIDIDSSNEIYIHSHGDKDIWIRSHSKDITLSAPSGNLRLKSRGVKHQHFEILG